MIRELLREGTQDHHARAEASLPLMDEALTRDRYARALARLLGFYAPLERRLDAADWEAIGLDWTARRKAPLLADDLRRLGHSATEIARLPACDDLPGIDGAARALGCLYVLEGATLGGQLVRRQLARRFAMGPDSGAGFFAAYGDAVGPMWRAYQQRLAELVEGGECAPDEVLDAARETFDALTRWLDGDAAIAGAA